MPLLEKVLCEVYLADVQVMLRAGFWIMTSHAPGTEGHPQSWRVWRAQISLAGAALQPRPPHRLRGQPETEAVVGEARRARGRWGRRTRPLGVATGLEGRPCSRRRGALP